MYIYVNITHVYLCIFMCIYMYIYMAMCLLLGAQGEASPVRVFHRLRAHLPACMHACMYACMNAHTNITRRVCGYSVYGMPVPLFIFPDHRLNGTWPYIHAYIHIYMYIHYVLFSHFSRSHQ